MDYSREMRNPSGDNKTHLEQKLNEIFSYLARGKKFHYNQSFGLRNLGLRGIANLHDKESICDYKSMISIKKTINDRLHWTPSIDESISKEYENYKISSMADFKNSFAIWQKNETELEDCISETLKLASMEDLMLYNELICLGKEVQEERFRSEAIYTRLNLGEWGGHDIARISKDIHCHLEKENNLDFTLS